MCLNIDYIRLSEIESKLKQILTSAHGKNPTPNVTYDHLDAVKANGTFTPLIDPITKKPILDLNGNLIPDPNKGGQWVATLAVPRDVGPEIAHKTMARPDYQNYLDQHENKLETLLEKNEKKKTPTYSKKIGKQDEE